MLILFSGMGADARLLRQIRLPEFRMLTPDHVPPQRGEDLPTYASRVADIHSITKSDIVGGASFGGMLAAEMAMQRETAGLVLLGSCLKPQMLPSLYRVAERAARLTPDFLLGLRSWRPLIRYRFGPITGEAEKCLAEMAADCPVEQFRAFGHMAMTWKGINLLSCPVLSIHGDRDRIIPWRLAEPGKVLKDAGHAFTLTHAAEVSVEIKNFVGRIIDYA